MARVRQGGGVAKHRLASETILLAFLTVACSGSGGEGQKAMAPGGAGGAAGSGGSVDSGGSGGSGGSSGVGNLTCESFAPCGGDVMGIWDVIETCPMGANTIDVYDDPACAAQPVEVATTFNGSIMYSATEETWDLHETGTEAITVSAACLAAIQAGEGIDCAALATVLGATSSVLSGTDCRVTIDINEALAETTAYAVQGTDITYSGFSDRVPYCVSGRQMGQDWGAFVLLLRKR